MSDTVGSGKVRVEDEQQFGLILDSSPNLAVLLGAAFFLRRFDGPIGLIGVEGPCIRAWEAAAAGAGPRRLTVVSLPADRDSVSHEGTELNAHVLPDTAAAVGDISRCCLIIVSSSDIRLFVSKARHIAHSRHDAGAAAVVVDTGVEASHGRLNARSSGFCLTMIQSVSSASLVRVTLVVTDTGAGPSHGRLVAR